MSLFGHRKVASRALASATAGSLLLSALAGIALSAADPAVAATPPAPLAGSLDPSWGTNGVATVSVAGSTGLVAANRVIALNDGSAIVAGVQPGQTGSAFVAKLTPSGSLDSTFGSGGLARPGLGSGLAGDTVSIARQATNGDIVVAGSVANGKSSALALVELTSSGTLDSAFGTGGKVVTPSATEPLTGAVSVAFSPNGAIDVVPRESDSGDGLAVVQYTPAGGLDPTFGTGGFSEITSNQPPSALSDLAYAANGNIVVAGYGSVTKSITDTIVARFTTDGQADTSFNATGVEAIDVSGNGASNAATAIAVDPAGNIVVAGTISAATSSAFVLRLTSSGTRDPSFGTNGLVSGGFDQAAGSGTAIAVDHLGRYLAAGGAGAPSTALGIERLTSGSNPFDPGFGVSSAPGTESVVCPQSTGGSAAATAEASSQKILVAGGCNGSLTVARLDAGNLSNLAMTTSTPQQPAGHGTVPLWQIPGSALQATASNLAGTGGFNTGGFNTGGFNTGGFNTGGFNTGGFNTGGFNTGGFNTGGFNTGGFGGTSNQPLVQSPLVDPAVGSLALSSIPLTVSTTDAAAPKSWEDVLVGTPYEGLATQSITLQQVLALSPAPAALERVTLSQIDLGSTPLRKSSIAAFAMGTTPISALPAPTGGWCAFLASQPANCTTTPSANSQSASLIDLELGGDSLQTYYSSTPINLVGLTVSKSALSYLLLANVDLALSSVGSTATTALRTPGTFLTCTPSATSSTCDNLTDAETAGNLQTGPGANVEALLADSPTAVGQLTLGNLLGGVVSQRDYPIEAVPAGTIIAASPMPATGAAYKVTFNLGCDAAASLVINPALPADFRIIPSTASMTVGSGSSAATVPVTVASDGSIRPSAPFSCAQTQPVAVNFQAEPSTILGPTTAGVSVSVSSDSLSLSNQAPVQVVKNFIPNDTPANPNAAGADTVYVGHIASPGDVDYFSLQPPAPGSTIVVTLSHLPADYDLVVYGPSQPQLRASGGFNTGGFNTGGFNTGGFNTGGFNTGGFNTGGFNTGGFNTPAGDPSATFASSGASAPPVLDPDVPRANLPLRGYSDNRGTQNESVAVKVTSGDTTPFLFQVSGYNGAWSNSPYVMRVSVIPPAPALACQARSFAYSGTAGSLPSTPLPADAQTLILVNQQRLGAMYGPVTLPDGTSGDAGAAIVAELQRLAGQPSVKGVVVPVEGDGTVAKAYSTWDSAPCDVAAANQVVTSINSLVDHLRAGLTNLKNVVIVGDDEAIPFGRVIDYSAAFNESRFTESNLGTGKDNAESSAARNGYLLSDNPYGDLAPTPYLSSQLFVPQLAVGRLVETPAEIANQITSYLSANGAINPSTAFVTGYAPFDKGAQQVSASLSSDVGASNSTSQINSTWTRTDAINGLTGAAHGYASVNAHYDIYRALPGNEDAANPLSTADLANINLQGGVEFTIGCHAALSIPDIYVANPTAAQKAMLLDWPQAVSHQGAAAYAGNTGYGLGDTDAIAYSEKLDSLFAANLGPTMTVGQALTFAKQAYVASVGNPSAYDAKALQENTFYGLPMWRVGANGASANVTLPPGPQSQTNPVSMATTPVDTPVTNFSLTTGSSGRGSYYTVGNQAPDVTPNQPIQPLTTVALPARNDGLVAHGAILEQLTSQDVSSFRPVYATPVADSSGFNPQPAISSADFPSVLQSVESSITPSGRRDSLILVPGQFFTGPGGSGTGTQRLYTDLKTSVLSSNSTDYTPPVISTVTGSIQGSVARFTVTTPDSNVVRGVVLMLISGGSNAQTWQHVELVKAANGQWVGTTNLPAGTSLVGQYFAQLANANGNVAVSSNKGQDFSAGSVGGFQVSVSPPPDGNTGIYPGPTETVTLTAPSGTSATYTLDGGPSTPYTGPVSVSGQGGHVLVATASNGVTTTFGFPIDSYDPTITATTPSQGATYQRGSTVTPNYSCTSAVTTVSCRGPATVDTSTPGAHTYTITSTDQFGRTSSTTISYTVVENSPTVTITSAPPAMTTATSASFVYASSDQYGDPLTTSCTLDGSAAACGPSTATYTVQPQLAAHTFTVTVTDPFGSSGSASYSWTVHAPPTVGINTATAPTDPTDQTTSKISYTIGDQYYSVSSLSEQCYLDGALLAQPSCTSTGANLPALTPGASLHTFKVVVTDPGGLSSAASWSWHVYFDTTTSPSPVVVNFPLSAHLTYHVNGSSSSSPLAGKVVNFYAGQTSSGQVPSGNPVCSATTDSTGTATCPAGDLSPTGAALLAGGVTAVYAGGPLGGSDPYLRSQGSAGVL